MRAPKFLSSRLRLSLQLLVLSWFTLSATRPLVRENSYLNMSDDGYGGGGGGGDDYDYDGPG